MNAADARGPTTSSGSPGMFEGAPQGAGGRGLAGCKNVWPAVAVSSTLEGGLRTAGRVPVGAHAPQLTVLCHTAATS